MATRGRPKKIVDVNVALRRKVTLATALKAAFTPVEFKRMISLSGLSKEQVADICLAFKD